MQFLRYGPIEGCLSLRYQEFFIALNKVCSGIKSNFSPSHFRDRLGANFKQVPKGAQHIFICKGSYRLIRLAFFASLKYANKLLIANYEPLHYTMDKRVSGKQCYV